MTKDEMVRWHHQLNGHDFEQAPGDGGGPESLACCCPWGHKESDTPERLNNSNNYIYIHTHTYTHTHTHIYIYISESLCCLLETNITL